MGSGFRPGAYPGSQSCFYSGFYIGFYLGFCLVCRAGSRGRFGLCVKVFVFDLRLVLLGSPLALNGVGDVFLNSHSCWLSCLEVYVDVTKCTGGWSRLVLHQSKIVSISCSALKTARCIRGYDKV